MTLKELRHILGDTKVINLTFTDSSAVAINLTGATVYLTVKSDFADTDVAAIFQKVVTVHTAPLSGQTQIVVDPADTSGVSSGTYKYDIQLIEASGKVSTVLRGNYVLIDEVTKTNA